MRIYLDLCVFNRPFDDQTNERIALETNVFLYILEKIEKKEYELVISDALLFENRKSPFIRRKKRIESYFSLSKEIIRIDPEVIKESEYLIQKDFSPLDALHLALAEKGKVNYFITCDDEIVRLFERNRHCFTIKIIGLLKFIAEEVK